MYLLSEKNKIYSVKRDEVSEFAPKSAVLVFSMLFWSGQFCGRLRNFIFAQRWLHHLEKVNPNAYGGRGSAWVLIVLFIVFIHHVVSIDN